LTSRVSVITTDVSVVCCLSVLDRISDRWCDSRHLYLFVELCAC